MIFLQFLGYSSCQGTPLLQIWYHKCAYFHINHILAAFFDEAAKIIHHHAGRPLAEENQHWRKRIYHRGAFWGGGSKNEDKHWAICQAFGQRSVFSINQFKHIQVNRLRRESIIVFFLFKDVENKHMHWHTLLVFPNKSTLTWRQSETKVLRQIRQGISQSESFVALDPETSGDFGPPSLWSLQPAETLFALDGCNQSLQLELPL